jgi:hypothetical protein
MRTSDQLNTAILEVLKEAKVLASRLHVDDDSRAVVRRKITDLFAKNSIAPNTIKILRENKILDWDNVKWLGPDPNILMADKVRTTLNTYTKNRRLARKAQQKEKAVAVKKPWEATSEIEAPLSAPIHDKDLQFLLRSLTLVVASGIDSVTLMKGKYRIEFSTVSE